MPADDASPYDLLPDEKAAFAALIAAWNAFVQLPVEHPDDDRDFRQGIHRLQAMILMRPARRSLDHVLETEANPRDLSVVPNALCQSIPHHRLCAVQTGGPCDYDCARDGPGPHR